MTKQNNLELVLQKNHEEKSEKQQTEQWIESLRWDHNTDSEIIRIKSINPVLGSEFVKHLKQ